MSLSSFRSTGSYRPPLPVWYRSSAPVLARVGQGRLIHGELDCIGLGFGAGSDARFGATLPGMCGT